MHLKADELVDLAEGARPESSAPHLAACPHCRTQLAELRAMMSAVTDVDVPEPSPLFWDHFSRRVHDAVAAEERAERRGWRDTIRRFVWQRTSLEPIASLALIVFAVIVVARMLLPGAPSSIAPAAVSQPIAQRDLLTDAPLDNDPSLVLVANLTATLDADGTSQTGLARVGSAEHAVTHMDDADLRELHRLLREEMAP
jgi:hypothetical protein